MRASIGASLQHVFSELSITTLQRTARRRLSAALEQNRPGSFPFLSADTFRALADTVVERGGVIARNPQRPKKIIFFDLSMLSGRHDEVSDSLPLQLLAGVITAESLPPVLILHNGDLLPSRDSLMFLEERSSHIFASNLVEESQKMTALPVGLENAYRNANGELADYLNFRDTGVAGPRNNTMFTSFNIRNNPAARAPLADMLSNSKYGWSGERITPSAYRQRVLESQFVLSPPGNGVDCHRTWEAVYLGAVPVVLASSTPPSFAENMPILAVENFSQFVEMSDLDLKNTYQEIRAQNPTSCYAPFWITRMEMMVQNV